MADTSEAPAPRFKPCFLLAKSNIPYVIWFEDALRHYRVPVCEFSLYLLVLDDQLDHAATCLTQAGWTLLSNAAPKIGNWEVNLPQRRLSMQIALLPCQCQGAAWY
jgi:hypothetical protein